MQTRMTSTFRAASVWASLSLAAGLILAASGCASAKPIANDHREDIQSLILGDIGRIDANVVDYILKADAQLEHGHGKRGVKRAALQVHSQVPIEIDYRVRWWIHYYAVREHELFQRMLDRGAGYKPMVEGVLRGHMMPPELYYLAMIESGYVTHAKSNAQAVGIWQFIHGTGIRYGLRYDPYTDERRHPGLATEAAAKHLLDLHRRFNSWYLALAAYNAGPERIAHAIRRGKSRDFWTLAEKRALPVETMNYIPKFLAAIIISSHYEKFGFHKPIPEESYPELEPVVVRPGVALSYLARQSGVELENLKRYNPQIRAGVISPQIRKARVWLPGVDAVKLREATAPRAPAASPPLLVSRMRRARPQLAQAVFTTSAGGRRVEGERRLVATPHSSIQ